MLINGSKRIVFKTVMCMCLVAGFVAVHISVSMGADTELDKSLKGIQFGVLSYFDYSVGQKPVSGGQESDFNEFRITRGYFTVKKQILPSKRHLPRLPAPSLKKQLKNKMQQLQSQTLI